LRRDCSRVPAKRQRSSGETATEFRWSGEMCQQKYWCSDEVVWVSFYMRLYGA
jgi:hypothetical protein